MPKPRRCAGPCRQKGARMNALPKMSSLIVLSWVMNVTYAQQPAPPAPADTPASADTPAPAPAVKPSKGTPQSEAGEPRGNTSRTPSPQTEAGEPRDNTSRPASAQSEAGPPRPTPPKPGPAAGARANTVRGQMPPGATNRLEVGTATVTGNRE